MKLAFLQINHRIINRSFLRRTAVTGVLLLLAVTESSGQSTLGGDVLGTVRDDRNAAVPRARVTLSAGGSSAEIGGTTSGDGSFALRLAPPGRYQLRVEAIGYQPLIVMGVVVVSGEPATVSVRLTPAAPPVVRVDTIILSGTGASRLRAGGLFSGVDEIDPLPDRTEDLASLVSLSPGFDASIGSQGLPGSESLIMADGVPFYRAANPSARGERIPDAIFAWPTLSGVLAASDQGDAGWPGSGGGYVTASTRSALTSPGFRFDAGYSGDPGWSSSRLDFTAPSMRSLWGNALGSLSLSPSAQLFVSGGGFNQDAPRAPRLSEAVALELAGLEPGLLEELSGTSVERSARYSGLARLDVQQSATTRVFVRAAAAQSERTFEGPVSVVSTDPLAPAESSLDVSTAFGLVNQYTPRLTLEFLAGFSASSRDFGSPDDGRPPAYLASSGVQLGNAAPGSSSRSDLYLAPVVHYAIGGGTMKVGANIRASRFSIEHSASADGQYFFSDGPALVAGRGLGVSTTAPEQSFRTQEFGLFGQISAPIASGVRFSGGARMDRERIAPGERSLNANWMGVSGLRTDDFVDGMNQFGARAAVIWDPTLDGSSRFHAAVSLREGDVDVNAVHAVLSQDSDGTSRLLMGPGLDWPDVTPPTALGGPLNSLTLLGPDTRAPRTLGLSVGVSQRVTSGLSLFAEGTSRRSDFLLRRRNLNLPIVPIASDPQGRPMYGSLTQDGSLIAANSADRRRFDAYDAVWALDPDGWSEYWGVTGGAEIRTARVDAYAAYTFSETTDNWVGARSGLPSRELDPLLPPGDEPWSDGVSDYDAPHRFVGTTTIRAGAVEVSGVLRFASGVPFTPRFRRGVDANGDGSFDNDPAYVPTLAELAPLLGDWPCLEQQAEGFAVRNSCRAPDTYTFDVRVSVDVGTIANRRATLMLEGFNVIEDRSGVIDEALWLVDPAGTVDTSPDGATVTIPLVLNTSFGDVIHSTGRGRSLRVGMRIGG